MSATSEILGDAKRIVVKIGSVLLVDTDNGALYREWLESLADDVASWTGRGREIVIVSSGAIALGRRYLKFKTGDLALEQKQAAAAAGMVRLAHAYQEALGRHDLTVAQILLTLDDSEDRRRYLNARNTLLVLLEYGVVPVINENDTVSVDEIRFGDNDVLAAMVCNLVDADRLIILTSVDGLYTADPSLNPDARLIPRVEDIDSIAAMASSATHSTGKGGMATKVRAARMAGAAGILTHIVNGFEPDSVLRVLAGEVVGTRIVPPETPRLSSRKRWIGYALKARGEICVDEGAKRALTTQGRSLLPSGIVGISGSFSFGDAVYCVDANAHRFAQGLVNYSATELREIRGQHTSRIESILGAKAYDEVIHRDNLVLL